MKRGKNSSDFDIGVRTHEQTHTTHSLTCTLSQNIKRYEFTHTKTVCFVRNEIVQRVYTYRTWVCFWLTLCCYRFSTCVCVCMMLDSKPRRHVLYPIERKEARKKTRKIIQKETVFVRTRVRVNLGGQNNKNTSPKTKSFAEQRTSVTVTRALRLLSLLHCPGLKNFQWTAIKYNPNSNHTTFICWQ